MSTSGDEPSLGGQDDEFAASVGLGGEHTILHLAEMVESEDGELAKKAIAALREAGTERAALALSEFVVSQPASSSVLQRAVRAISLIGGETAIQALLTLSGSEDTGIRQSAVTNLNRLMPDPRILETLITLSGDAVDEIRRIALQYLAVLKDESALPIVLVHAADTSGQVRAEVARGLKHWLHDPLSINCLYDLLADEEWDVVRSAGASLGRATSPEISKHLIDAMASPNSSMRAGAAIALGGMRPPESLPLLIAAMSDSDRHVCTSAALAAGEFGDKTVVPALILLLGHQAHDARMAAVSVLKRLADPRALEPLFKSLMRTIGMRDISIAVEYIDAMRASGDADPYLIRLLQEHRNSFVQSEAARRLAYGREEPPDQYAVDALIAALDDPDYEVMRSAGLALQRIDTPEARAGIDAWLAARQERNA
jgi:HEAT repeat protein